MLIPLSDIEVKPHSHENSQPAFSFGRAGQFSLPMMVMLIEMMLLMIVTRTILMMRGMKMVEPKIFETNNLILTPDGCSVLALKGCYIRIHLNKQIIVLILLKKKFFMFPIIIKRMEEVVLLDRSIYKTIFFV